MFNISLSSTSNRILCIIKRHLKSALYITGEKAQHMFVAIHPYIDFEKKLRDKESLLENISKRSLNIDLDRIINRYFFYKSIEEKKIILEKTRDELNNIYSEVTKQSDVNIDEVNKLTLHKHVVKEELRSLREYIEGLEENVMISILNLPNDLYVSTPDANLIIHMYSEKPVHQSDCHKDIGLKLNYLKLVDGWGCYLMSDAASFEVAVSNYVINNLITCNYIQFQNADFVRSVVVEGCGTEVMNNKEILTIYEPKVKNQILQEYSRLHLTGSASTYAFMAYFSKHLVQKSHFPLKYFCYGRSYNGNIGKNDDLFSLNQQSVINIFLATLEETVSEQLEDVIHLIKKIYDNLGYHYRLVQLEPSELNRSESSRLSIQMFSNYLQKYVEVGYLSYYDSYISERLLFSVVENKERIFPKIIGGDILNVHKILGCVLENTSASKTDLLSGLLKQSIL
ncbi:hypothetical protein WA026_009850 [Henosepilachna vigintioctopunctata]|uniref:Aminoacyl-tRNA synthetase class II (G/ P/ S/T) domain-containing protein n=1 Tax=Henosepilachna vigintioctopunctata TaxID=420089 RepID=A0AAW1TRC9_9CUCU